MKTFKPTDPVSTPRLYTAAANIKAANAMISAAKKLGESGKQAIADWLRTERDTDIEVLPIGELVNIEGICLIEIGSMNKFDEASFQLADPEQHAKFKRDIPVKKFKPLT